MIYNYDIKFMAVPNRLANVLKCLNFLKLRYSDVALDEKCEKKPIKTMMKALRMPHDETITHRVIAQDDVEFGSKFRDNVSFLINNYPDNVFSLFIAGSSKKELYKTEDKIICKTGGGIWGQAVIIPLKYMSDIEGHLTMLDEKWQHDDIFLQYVFSRLGVKVLTTIPCIVDHLGKGKEKSAMEHGWGESDNYRYDRDADVSEFVPKLNMSLGINRSYSIDKYIRV